MKRSLLIFLLVLLAVTLISCATCKQTKQKEDSTYPNYEDEKAKEVSVPIIENQPVSTSKEYVYYDTPPRKIKESILRYPDFARKSRIQGTVTLEIEILTDGSIGTIEVKKSVLPGHGGLDEAAIEYARGLKFEPAKANGKPVAVWITYPVNFYLD